ncbi:MAG: hypothetical protein LBH98_02270 [Chitinispirillales bacterium]|jgi:hypothetical protein|nr:hypothetical protein [Chitinispirillales bacterium]
MTITYQQTEKMLKGNLPFSQLGFSLLVTRHKKLYAQTPTSKIVDDCVNEINAFLAKYGTIVAKDFALIQKL